MEYVTALFLGLTLDPLRKNARAAPSLNYGFHCQFPTNLDPRVACERRGGKRQLEIRLRSQANPRASYKDFRKQRSVLKIIGQLFAKTKAQEIVLIPAYFFI